MTPRPGALGRKSNTRCSAETESAPRVTLNENTRTDDRRTDGRTKLLHQHGGAIKTVACDVNSYGCVSRRRGEDVTAVDCYCVVYSVADRNTFINSVSTLDALTSSVRHTTACILIGNKTDLVRQRQVFEHGTYNSESSSTNVRPYTLCPKKTCDYIFYNNFNSRCPITIIFGIVSSKSMSHRKMVSFSTSPI